MLTRYIQEIFTLEIKDMSWNLFGTKQITAFFNHNRTRQNLPRPQKSIPSAKINQRRAFYSYYPFQGITGTSEVSSLKK